MERKIHGTTERDQEAICHVKALEEHVIEYSFTCPHSEQEEILSLEWYEPISGAIGCWHPDCRYERTFGADWQKERKTMLSISAPVYCLYDQAGNNCFTAALSETVREVNWRTGVHEEDGTFLFHCEIHLGRGKNSVKLYINEKREKYTESLKAVQKWWEKDCGINQAFVPEAAKQPFYSTWYSYHQNIEAAQLEKECKLAAELGFRGILVDDGWQTEDTRRGYAFCGDWEPAESKLPHMKEHVAYVHSLGMKYMLWVSVPFIGKHSKIWDRFSDKLLEYQDSMDAGVADIRYREVREYLMDEYETLVKTYDLDGLKMDFIDEFYEGVDTPPYKETMDMREVQDALECMMIELYKKLRAFKPDILIEFRQKYIGPYIRKFGNMLRVDDCPMSPLANRVGIADLRVLSGNTAVHSDMIMWNPEETPEGVAIALLHCFFGCLQLSVPLENCSEEIKNVIRNYMNLAETYFDARLEGSFTAEAPENLYPMLSGEKDGEAVVGIYEANKIVSVKEHWKKVLLLHASYGEAIYLEFEKACPAKILVRDCQGKVTKEYEEMAAGIVKLPEAPGSSVEIQFLEEKK